MGALMFTLQKHEKLMMFPKMALHLIAPVKGSETHFRDAPSPLFEELCLCKSQLKNRDGVRRKTLMCVEDGVKKRR